MVKPRSFDNSSCARHSLAERIRDTVSYNGDPTLCLPETVDNIYDPGLEDEGIIGIQVPIGDGCSRRSSTQSC